MGRAEISNDGRYCMYTIDNMPVGKTTTILQSTDGRKKKVLENVHNGIFSSDSKFFFFVNRNDSLCELSLSGFYIKYYHKVSSVRLIKMGNDEWIVYQNSGFDKSLVFKQLKTGKEQRYSYVSSYKLDADNKMMALLTDTVRSDLLSLYWVSLPSGVATKVWSDRNITETIISPCGNQIAFSTSYKSESTYFLYNRPTDKVTRLLHNEHIIPDGMTPDRITRFSRNGKLLFFTLKDTVVMKPDPDAAPVDVWSYSDEIIQSVQLKSIDARSYLAVLDLNSHNVNRLEYEYENVSLLDTDTATIGIVSAHDDIFTNESWNVLTKPKFAILSPETGKREEIAINLRTVSPSHKYIYDDDGNNDSYLYDISRRKLINLTRSLSLPPTMEYSPLQEGNNSFSIVGWLRNDEGVLVSDGYDIWQIDPLNEHEPICITNHTGRKSDIVFGLLNYSSSQVVDQNEVLFLTAFDQKTMNNGFYRKILKKPGDPELLSAGPYIYSIPVSEVVGIYAVRPICKAQGAKVYIVRRESASQFPNYFSTSDFKKFTPLSSIYPEKSYNWLTSQLIHYNSLDKVPLRGALFKPEDFDSTKKYPVIINYYEKRAPGLNQYLYPIPMSSDIDLPTFVSNGYLVLEADIFYKKGEPGHSAYSAIVGAAKELMKYPWVDAGKIGIQGHSFGGYETNYIISHSDIFAAALSSSGFSNLISAAGTLKEDDGSNFFCNWSESGQGRVGSSFYDNPELYIRNSPIFKTASIITPLLMVNNKGDGSVPFQQGVELFLALRRLGKKVWMLQYDGAGHTIGDMKSNLDYQVRAFQFFDHYLKGKPAPKWMTRGVPARFKMKDRGLGLDTSTNPFKSSLLSVEK